MPTWKRKDEEGNVHFQFLCRSCSRKKKDLLEKEKWIFVRDGDPACCNDCALHCALTAQGLWGAEEQVRYQVCERCPGYGACELKGRYYC